MGSLPADGNLPPTEERRTSSLAQFGKSLLCGDSVCLPELFPTLKLVDIGVLLVAEQRSTGVFESARGGGQSDAVAQEGGECASCGPVRTNV